MMFTVAAKRGFLTTYSEDLLNFPCRLPQKLTVYVSVFTYIHAHSNFLLGCAAALAGAPISGFWLFGELCCSPGGRANLRVLAFGMGCVCCSPGRRADCRALTLDAL